MPVSLCINLCVIHITSKFLIHTHVEVNSCLIFLRLLIYNGLSILPLLGLTWVFGLLAINQATSVFLWLFTVFNSLQVIISEYYI